MKSFLRTIMTLVVCGINLNSVWAQNITVSGKIVAVEDGQSLPGASVVLKGTTNGANADAEGNFKLTVSHA